MGDPQNPNTGKPCEICGDIGWEATLTICSKCKKTREHNYCMRLMRISYEGAKNWVCEGCDSSNQMPSTKPVPNRKSSGTGIFIKNPPQNSKVQYITPEEARNLESGAVQNKSSSPSKSGFAHRSSAKKPLESKTEASRSSTLPPKVRTPNSQVSRSGGREPLNNRSVPSSSKDKNLSASTEKEKTVTQKEHACQETPRRSSARNTQTLMAAMQKETDGPARQQFVENPTDMQLTSGNLPKPSTSSVGRKQQFSMVKDNINTGNTSLLVPSFPSVSSDLVDDRVVTHPKDIDSEESDSPKIMMVVFDRYLPNHPAVSPTWKGAFVVIGDILPSTFLDEIQAHPPCKVHSKVYKLSKQLPMTLKFEMLPRRNYWLDFFEGDVPGELDIGLYFLPSKTPNLNGTESTGGFEQSYRSLLEYLDEHDLLLRGDIDEVELFVVSSKHLQEDSCKINQKHFLWGLFRPVEANIAGPEKTVLAQNCEVRNKINVASRAEALVCVNAIHSSDNEQKLLTQVQVQQHHPQEHEAEDMDVDMLGGYEVGAADVVIPKPSDNVCEDRKERSMEPSTEIKSTGGSVLEFSPIKVKREWTESDGDGVEASLRHAISSCLEDEIEFERELQMSFDRFAALMHGNEAGCLEMDVKKEAND